LINYAVIGPHNWEHITFNYFKTVPSCSNKGDIYGEREKRSLSSYYVALNESLQSSETLPVTTQYTDD
jgi:hypothetical protein